VLDNWVYEGARDICRKLECLQSIATVATTASTQTYSLSTVNFFRIHYGEWQPTGDSTTYPLTYRDWHTMSEVWGSSQRITQGTPEVWTLWGQPPNVTASLYPIPSAVGTLRIYYYRLPIVKASDATLVEVPEGWDDLVVDYAEFMALRRDRDPRWQEAFGLYNERLKDMQATVGARWTDQAGTMLHVGAGSSAWMYEDW
jgi:hypothetical protein